MATEKQTSRAMPKGGRKGGVTFPRVALDQALKFSKKLVGKTHTGPQSADIVYSGVVGAKGGKGDVRISALRQYGLLSGDKRGGFLASPLAKQIASAPEEELQKLHRQAALSPKIFKAIYDTFHGDTVSRGKLRHRAGDLNVHPDELDTCVEFYVRSLATAGLLSSANDQVTHVAGVDVVAEDDDIGESPGDRVDGEADRVSESDGAPFASKGEDADDVSGSSARPVRSNINVNITLDSSMDIDKLAKQLELLKKYGAI